MRLFSGIFKHCDVSKLQFYHHLCWPTAELKRIMSNVWPIAIIALLTIVILFYALEQCGKILKGRQGRNLNKRSDKQRKTSNLDTIHEQHVSPSFHSSLHHLGSLRSRKKSHFTCILEHSVWKSQKKSHSTLRAKRVTFTFWVDKSSLEMPKMVNFDEVLNFGTFHQFLYY